MSRITRRGALVSGAASISTAALPRFAIGQADTRPTITIAVQKISNSNTLDCLREQSKEPLNKSELFALPGCL